MKSQIIFRNKVIKLNKGFLTVEIMIAFSLFVMFAITTFTLNSSIPKMKLWSIEELNTMETLSKDILNNTNLGDTYYGNYTKIFFNKLFSISKTNFIDSWGKTYCDSKLKFDIKDYDLRQNNIDIGVSNHSTDIEVRNNTVYLSADSSISSRSDLFIFDTNDINNTKLISSINTGPGVSALEVVGPYVYLAQASTINQLQVLDIHDRFNPKLISQIKLPLPTSSTTPPFASSIHYSRGYVYLGTEKWNGYELSIVSVQDPYNPMIVGSFETNTLINDILVIDNKAYLASSDEKQMRVLDVSNPNNPISVNTFSPSGWQTQEGKILELFEDSIALGRTVGGYNVQANHELFIFPTSTPMKSKDIVGGVYGLLLRDKYVLMLTHNNGKEFQVFDTKSMNKIADIGLGSSPIKMVCDNNNIFFATGDSKGFIFLKKNE